MCFVCQSEKKLCKQDKIVADAPSLYVYALSTLLHVAEINIVQPAHTKMMFNFEWNSLCMFLYRAVRISKNVVCLGTKTTLYQFISIMNTLFIIPEKQTWPFRVFWCLFQWTPYISLLVSVIYRGTAPVLYLPWSHPLWSTSQGHDKKIRQRFTRPL